MTMLLTRRSQANTKRKFWPSREADEHAACYFEIELSVICNLCTTKTFPTTLSRVFFVSAWNVYLAKMKPQQNRNSFVEEIASLVSFAEN